ncbi:MAG: hypothetical protein E5X48_25110 [Mesorhizobium sp.]|uniref:hypothetical protein n=1 Tax=Mesorhizobium sp. TaxID=1871066 RepID=UPI0011F4235D|nr:hypothetical protein [Mesorhizobium sp.]TIQ33090.1 MAG: hypothetical protein E5X48_25110 [Mesorhizobium sp.]
MTGVLSSLFRGIVFKRLANVEVDATRSNQHEFNGSRPLLDLFGREQPLRMPTDFYHMSDIGHLQSERGLLTWYDARARHPTRTEYRLYYYDNAVTRQAKAGDTLIIGRKVDGSTFLLVAPSTGAVAKRIAWLFGIEVAPGAAFAALDLDAAEKAGLSNALGLSDADDTSFWQAEESPRLAAEPPELRDAIRVLQKQLGSHGNGKTDHASSTFIPDDQS